MKIRLLLLLNFTLGLGACKHQPQEIPAPSGCASVTFSGQVNPIIQQNCAISGCHVANFPDGDFTKFSDLHEKVTDGSFKNSVIDWNAPRMPDNHKLPEENIRILQCWLNQGAPNN